MTEDNLKFHIANGDLFGTLATILDLVRQSSDRQEFRDVSDKMLASAVDQLVYLDKEFRLARKDPSSG